EAEEHSAIGENEANRRLARRRRHGDHPGHRQRGGHPAVHANQIGPFGCYLGLDSAHPDLRFHRAPPQIVATASTNLLLVSSTPLSVCLPSGNGISERSDSPRAFSITK